MTNVVITNDTVAAGVKGKSNRLTGIHHFLCLECFDYINHIPGYIFNLFFDSLLVMSDLVPGTQCNACEKMIKPALQEFEVMPSIDDVVTVFPRSFYSTDIHSALEDAHRYYKMHYTTFKIKSIKEL